MSKVKAIVTVDKDLSKIEIETTVKELEKIGFETDSTLHLIGLVVGSVDENLFEQIRQVKGVETVREELLTSLTRLVD